MRQVGIARQFAAYRMEAAGRFQDADSQLRQGLAEAEPLAVAGSETMLIQEAGEYRELASLHARHRDRDRALSFAAKAVDLATAWLARDPASENAKASLFRALVTSAHTHDLLGDREPARADAQKAADLYRRLADNGNLRYRSDIQTAEAILAAASQ